MSNIHANFRDGSLTIQDDASHSATLSLAEGDLSIEYSAQDGAETSTYETRGHITGRRKAKRSQVKISFSAKLADPGDSFIRLAEGRTSGYVSTEADIGDANSVDWSFTFNYGAQVRRYYGEDLVFETISIKEGDPSTISFSATCDGPCYSQDSTNGIITLVSSR